jgi:predicted aspartyl protease
MSFRYSPRYHPPVPAAEIALGAPEADFTLGPLPAILDTGADITLIPREYLIQLDAPVVAGGFLRSPWGERESVKIYEVNLRIAGRDLYHVEVASQLEEREVLLGRNVLNLLNLQLDGPNEIVSMLS